jgi:hypothetical protein
MAALGTGVTLAVTLATGVPAALACSKGETEHCYAISRFVMNEAKGEAAFGAFANMELFYGRTPWYLSGDRQNGEIWVEMSPNHARWIEGGAYIGAHYTSEGSSSERTPYYFLAASYGPGTYAEYDYPGTGPAYETWYGLYLAEREGKPNGEWCAQWAWDKVPDRCWIDFRTKSTELETGLEYATSPISGAEINGRSVGWQEWTNWTWHESWSGAYAHATPYRTGSPLCVTEPVPGHTYGSVAFAAPGC